jgi:hypothetical protein
MHMSKFCRFPNFPILPLLLCAIAALCGCASYEAQNTESLLSASGFRIRTPSTAAQQAMCNRMTPYKLERRVRNGKVLYAYADKAKNVVYIGGETEFQRYKQLGLQQSIAEQNLEAAEINEEASLYDFGPYWGPWNPWW